VKYCSECSAALYQAIPEGDNRPRHICPECGTIHYANPKMVVGCLPEWEDRLLLCRRAIEPRYGLWTLPAGFMELNETAEEGAARETLEEANARVEVTGLYTLFNLPHVDQVYLLFRSRLQDLDFGPGSESLEVALFDEHRIPWDSIAFKVVEETLRLYFDDRRTGRFRPHVGTIRRISGNPRRYQTVMLQSE